LPCQKEKLIKIYSLIKRLKITITITFVRNKFSLNALQRVNFIEMFYVCRETSIIIAYYYVKPCKKFTNLFLLYI